MFELKDYKDFCNEQTDCNKCPLSGDELTGFYNCCIGFIVEHSSKAEEIIATWKEKSRRRQTVDRQTIFIVTSEYDNSIYGTASSKEKAEEIIEKSAKEVLENCIAVDPEDSGIYWEDWDEARRNEFYEKEIKSGYQIIERKMDTYITEDGEVELV